MARLPEAVLPSRCTAIQNRISAGLQLMIFRRATETDKPTLARWIQNDEDHRGRVSADFFIDPEQECSILHDEHGPIMGVRIERVLRVHIQFDPTERIRSAKALAAVFPWVQKKAKEAGFREMIFESISKPLIK